MSKNKFWIDCPLCSVRMKQGKGFKGGIIWFCCIFCDTVTEIQWSKKKTQRDEHRRELLEKRRIKT